MGLFNSAVLDWAIGIVFVYLMLAIMCTTINEWIAGISGIRAKTLAKGVAQLLDEQKGSDPTRSFLEDFYRHPLVSSMMAPGKQASEGHPSYLPSRTFATAVMDLATSTKLGSITFADLESGVKNLPPGDVRTALLALIQNAHGDLDRAQKNIEAWFDDSMERVSGWYKRWTQIAVVCIATLLTISTNADTVRIARVLWTNGTERSLIVERAKNAPASASPDGSVSDPDKNNPTRLVYSPKGDDLAALKSVLGWSGEDLNDWRGWPPRVLGWFLSIAAISLGAPFWFDTLNKLMNLRNAGKKPAQSASAPGDDKKSAPQPAVPATTGS